MISKGFLENLNGVVFPRKLWLLATSNEIQSIRWARNGTTLEIDSVLLCEECFHPHIFNVKSNQHVLRQLSYYKFEKLDHKKKIWEFRHPNFQAGKEGLLHLIKRTPQRVPKKFTKDVERRCSSRIRSMSSKKTQGMYKIDSDEEMDTETEYVETNPLATKIKLEVEENIGNRYNLDSNNKCSHGVPVEFMAPSTSISFSKNTSSGAYEGHSNGWPERKVKKSASVGPSIKRKRGRPRKSTADPKSVSKKQSFSKIRGMQPSDREVSPSIKYFKLPGTIPTQETFAGYDYSYWAHENHGFRDRSPMGESGKYHVSNYIARIASKKVSGEEPDKRAIFELEDKSGVTELCLTDGSRYHGIDTDGRTAQVAPDWFISKDGTWQSNLPPLSGEEIPIILNVFRSDLKRSESGELYYRFKKEDCFFEKESAENSCNDADNDSFTTNQSNNEEVYSRFENGHDFVIADAITTSQAADSALSEFSFSICKPPINSYMVGNPSSEVQQYRKENQAASSNASFYDKNVILPEVPEIRKPNSYNMQGKDYFQPNNRQDDNSPGQQSSSSNLMQDNDVPHPVLEPRNHSNCNPRSFLIETNKNSQNSDEINLVNLTDLDDNCKANNQSPSLNINPNRKSSQSKMIVPLSSECQQWYRKKANNFIREVDVCSTENDHYNYSSENGDTYTLEEIIMESDVSQNFTQRSPSTKITNPDTTCVKQDFQEQKSTDIESELANLNSNVNEMQYVSSEVLYLEQEGQNCNIASSESYPPFVDSCIEISEESDKVEEQNSKNSSSESFPDSSSQIFQEGNQLESLGQNCIVPPLQCFSPSLGSSVHQESDEVAQPMQNFTGPPESCKSFVERSDQDFEGKDKMEQPGQNCIVSSSAEPNAETFRESTEPGAFGSIDDQINRLIHELKVADNSDDVTYLGQISSTQQEFQELFATLRIPDTNTDESRSNGVENSQDSDHLEVAPFNFFASEVKPMTLFDFLSEQFKNGKLYSWKARESDIIIHNCTADFGNWISFKSGGKSNVHP